MRERKAAIVIPPRQMVRVLAAIAALLTLVYLMLLVFRAVTGHGYIYGLFWLLDLGDERNIPSCFSGCLFMLNALMLALVAKTSPGSTSRATWSALALIFVFLTYDEIFGVHERMTMPLRATLQTSGLFYYAWVLGYLPVVALLALLFLPTWRRLDAPVRSALSCAAGVYLAGAVGFEMLGGAYEEAFATNRDIIYGLLVAAEESLEMAGLIMLTHGLLKLLQQATGSELVTIMNDTIHQEARRHPRRRSRSLHMVELPASRDSAAPTPVRAKRSVS